MALGFKNDMMNEFGEVDCEQWQVWEFSLWWATFKYECLS